MTFVLLIVLLTPDPRTNASLSFFEAVLAKALHSELFTELSSRFSSRNEFFMIFEFGVEHHFFVIFGKFGNSWFPKFPNLFWTFSEHFLIFFPNFPNFFWIFPNLSTQKQGFFVRFQILCSFFEIFEIYVQFWVISEPFSEFKFPNFFPNFFAKFLRVWKFLLFPKNFRASKMKLFRNSRKWKVWKFLSNAGPQFCPGFEYF